MVTDDARFDETPRPGAPSEVEQLRTLLYTDDLTGLYNRRFFRHCIDEQKAQSETTGAPFALLIMDIDHFKEINDTYGHAIGDAALMKIASLLRETLRERGWVFRYAGDEFVAILRGSGHEETAAVCSNILKRVSGCLKENIEGFPLKSISVSIGFSIYPHDTAVISDLLHLSDRALYASKQAGRNCFHSAKEVADRQEQTGIWPVSVYCESLVGRQLEWDLLQSYFSECKNGKGRLVFIAGEAGIGKSRLLRQFCKRQRAGDYHILFGDCTEGTLIHSYAPFRDALKKGFEAKDPATVNLYKELDELYRRELIALVPQFDRFEKEELPPAQSSDRYFLLESVLMLLQGLARQLPTVLVLEDIHWSDEATLNLLHYLARNVRKERILLIATFRDEDAVHTPLPAVIQNMSREDLFEMISLKPLKKEETGTMLEEIFAGYNVYEPFKRWIHQETEGIPFYIEELLKLLLEENYIQRSGRDVELRKPEKFILPYSIRALVQRRISRLGESLQRVLGFASIIGYEFDLHILVKLIEENEGYLLDLLEQLTKLQLIREVNSAAEERFAFAHNKIRDVIYEEMGLIKRKKFHRRVGEILETVHSNNLQLYSEDLAYHFENGGVIPKAFAYSLEAGKKALQLHAYNEAQLHFERCSKYTNLLDTGGAELMAELYTYSGLALEALGSWEGAIKNYELLLTLKKPGALRILEADGLNHLSRVHYKREDFDASLTLAEQAMRIARDQEYRNGLCSSFYNLGKTYWRLCDYDLALNYLNQAVELTDPDHDAGQRAKYLNSTGIIHLERSEYDKALQCFRKALDIFQQRADKPGIIECLVNISIVRHLQGSLHEARQHIVNAFAHAQEIGDPFGIAACAVNQAEIEYNLANYELGNKLNERAGRIYNELNHSLGLTYYLQNESHYLMLKGRLEASSESVQKGRAIAEEKNLKKRASELFRIEASVKYFMGDYSGSIQCLNECLQLTQSMKDRAGYAESEIKLGYIYFALSDFKEAEAHWSRGLNPGNYTPSSEFLFWKAGAEGFIELLKRNSTGALTLQREMRTVAENMDHAHLTTVSLILSSMQLRFLKQRQEATMLSQDAEKSASLYHQDLWLTRAKMNLLEDKKAMEVASSDAEILNLLQTAKEQKQNDVVHRCYKMLRQSSSADQKLYDEWKKHFESWKNQIPEKYRNQFDPSLL